MNSISGKQIYTGLECNDAFRITRKKVNGSHLICFSPKYFRIEAISGVVTKSNNKHHKCYVYLRRPPSGSLPANDSLTGEISSLPAPSPNKGLSPASSGCCSSCPQRGGAEACLPGPRKGWKGLSALSVSLIKNYHTFRAGSPMCFLLQVGAA